MGGAFRQSKGKGKQSREEKAVNAERMLQALAHNDLNIWNELSRKIERKGDGMLACQVIRSLDQQGQRPRLAQWFSHLEKHLHLQNLCAGILDLVRNWPPSDLRTCIRDLLSGEFKWIPGGEFMMGSPPDEQGRQADETQHKERVERPYFLKSTPVTQGEWQALMGYNPSQYKDDLLRPVERVSWYDAITYCNTLSRREGLVEAYRLINVHGDPGEDHYRADVYWNGVECNGYCLPTEIEWEYACRAGTMTPFYQHDGDPNASQPYNLDDIAWYYSNAQGRHRTTNPVRQKKANPWGLYDMLGNVYDWCQDWYEGYTQSQRRDPQGPIQGLCVLRGACWYSTQGYCRAARRLRGTPDGRDSGVGLRPARHQTH